MVCERKERKRKIERKKEKTGRERENKREILDNIWQFLVKRLTI